MRVLFTFYEDYIILYEKKSISLSNLIWKKKFSRVPTFTETSLLFSSSNMISKFVCVIFQHPVYEHAKPIRGVSTNPASNT